MCDCNKNIMTDAQSKTTNQHSVPESGAPIGLYWGRSDLFNSFDGDEMPQILSVSPYIVEPSTIDPYSYAIGVGRKGRVAGRKAKRAAKKSGASNKEARAAKKTTKATYAEEGTRRYDVLTRRADKLTTKATTKFGSKERKAGMKEVRKERRGQIKKNAYKFVVMSITAPILGAAMALMAVNFRGMASKIATATPAEQTKMKKRWERMGGNFKNFMKVANNNKDKKPFMCAANCKKDLAADIQARGAKAVLDEVPKAEVSEVYSNAVATASISAAVALGGTLVSSLIAMISKKKETKAVDAEIAAQEELEKQEFDNLSELEKQQIKEAERLLKKEADWKTTIMNDPSLSEEEKKEAIKIYEGMESDGIDWLQVGMVAGGIVLVGSLIYVIATSGGKSGAAANV